MGGSVDCGQVRVPRVPVPENVASLMATLLTVTFPVFFTANW